MIKTNREEIFAAIAEIVDAALMYYGTEETKEHRDFYSRLSCRQRVSRALETILGKPDKKITAMSELNTIIDLCRARNSTG